MSRLSRRSVLRSGVGLALSTAIAGCSDRIGGTAEATGEIPGVEDGKVADHHAFASAHHDQLEARTGTLEWTRTALDGETGDPRTHAVWTVRVEGDRLHAVVAGRTPIAGPSGTDESDTSRSEYYFGENATAYYRMRVDGEWKVRSVGPNETPLTAGDFTGRDMLETGPLKRVGTETVDGEELYRFGHATRVPDNERVHWTSIQALLDGDALVHSFQQTLDRTTRDDRRTRRVDEWHLTAPDATTVERPDWVAEADE